MSIKLWILLIMIVIAAIAIGLRIFQKLPESVMNLLGFLFVMIIIILGIVYLFKKMSQQSSWN